MFTQGQAGNDEHLLATRNIPVLRTDRGGQVTYHGPGQLVGYILLNVKRRKIGVRALVDVLERSMLETLSYYGIEAFTKPKAPGVYVKNAKIGALGLRIKNGWSYHGFSLNVDMDLEPFTRINPCGFAGLEVTDIVSEGGNVKVQSIQDRVVGHVQGVFGYTAPLHPKKNIAVS